MFEHGYIKEEINQAQFLNIEYDNQILRTWGYIIENKGEPVGCFEKSDWKYFALMRET